MLYAATFSMLKMAGDENTVVLLFTIYSLAVTVSSRVVGRGRIDKKGGATILEQK